MATLRKPLLVYDGRCAFCLLWIGRWKLMSAGTVEFAPASEAAPQHPSIPPGTFARSVVLIRPDGTYLTGALAALTAISASVAGRRLLALYNRLPGFRPTAERLYRFVSLHREEMYLLTRALWGRSTAPHGFSTTRWLVLRGLALVYLLAFVSCLPQLRGLVGSNGISPVGMFLDAVYSQAGPGGPLYAPTLAWFDPGDGVLSTVCVAGIVSAALLLAGLAPRLAASACWLLYLSTAVAGQAFFRHPWDDLLLEAGFLAIFYAPRGLVRPATGGPPRAARWLLWMLVLRLTFMSGVAKLASGDIHWWTLSALGFHFETQPLPTPLAWYAHGVPAWILALSAFLMFCIEVGAPFLVFTPRRARHLGALLMIFLQVLIALTGNFAFLNLLTIVLCVALLDDGVTARLVPAFLRPGDPGGIVPGAPGGGGQPPFPPVGRPAGAGRSVAGVAAFAFMLFLNVNQLAGLFVPRAWWPSPVASATAWAEHFRIVNGYGPVRAVAVKRPELIVEGSDDRKAWREYAFRFKPGDPAAPLPWVAPWPPRLDWQMWSAASGTPADNEWLGNLAVRILEGSPEVIGLLGNDPFAGRPPKWVRMVLYEYRFATSAEAAAEGVVWKRSFNSLYLPPISLEAP